MSLLGTFGTSNLGVTITRKFTMIRFEGTFNVCEATLELDEIHEKYRKNLNTLAKQNEVSPRWCLPRDFLAYLQVVYSRFSHVVEIF